jgi:hypothetical protein
MLDSYGFDRCDARMSRMSISETRNCDLLGERLGLGTWGERIKSLVGSAKGTSR